VTNFYLKIISKVHVDIFKVVHNIFLLKKMILAREYKRLHESLMRLLIRKYMVETFKVDIIKTFDTMVWKFLLMCFMCLDSIISSTNRLVSLLFLQSFFSICFVSLAHCARHLCVA